MIIKRLTMFNFGVYAGINTFTFNHQKPIALIGGMNGRGKTTFLEAILLALYGTNSTAYKESNYKSYSQYLRAYVNKNNKDKDCYVELEFNNLETGEDTIMVRREWNAISKRTREKISVYRDGVCNDFLASNWGAFIESILPNALASFYFFDGEKIAELAVDDTNVQMKDSVRAMLGITVLDVLKNDLERSFKKSSQKVKGKETIEELNHLRNLKEETENLLEEKDKEITLMKTTVSKMSIKIEKLRQEYNVKGGDAIDQRQAIIAQRSELQSDLLKNKETIISLASTELPLVLVKKLIANLKLQAEDEHNDFVMKQAIDQIRLLLEQYLVDNPEGANSSRSFVEYVVNETNENNVDNIYGLSDHALFQANNLLEKSLDLRVEQSAKAISQNSKLKNKIDELDGYLSLDINEKELSTIRNKIHSSEKRMLDLKISLAGLEKERSSINAMTTARSAEFNRYTESFLKNVELVDDADRMAKYTSMALKITECYTIELQKRKTGLLGETITKCYKKLTYKKNLIDKIIMSPDTLDIVYMDRNGNTVPKNSLSAGEKQLMVISILWALAICSKKKLPVIIDTPLSRLDSLHRKALVTTYFPNASEQTIILSTDSEIDSNYYELMKENVGDEFTLVYNEDSQCTTIKEGYFR